MYKAQEYNTYAKVVSYKFANIYSYSWFHIKVTWSVHSFNGDYLSIPQILVIILLAVYLYLYFCWSWKSQSYFFFSQDSYSNPIYGKLCTAPLKRLITHALLKHFSRGGGPGQSLGDKFLLFWERILKTIKQPNK